MYKVLFLVPPDQEKYENDDSPSSVQSYCVELQNWYEENILQLKHQVGRCWNLGILNMPNQLGSNVLSAVGEAALRDVVESK